MNVLYDSHNEFYKSPFGALKCHEKCTIRILVPLSVKPQSVKLEISGCSDIFISVPMLPGEKREDKYQVWEGSFALFAEGLYFYCFKILSEDNEYYVFRQGLHETSLDSCDKWQITCYNENINTSDSFRGSVIYQIFPDRFAKSGDPELSEKLQPFSVHLSDDETPLWYADRDGNWNNDFFGGNLRGIEDKLPYLRELGVEVIYLNPIFKAFSNHRYDTADYMTVDPMLGTDDDFKSLCLKAHSMNISVILDGVFSHTGSNSVYFDKNNIFGNGAYFRKDSPYYSWYSFTSYPEQYETWWGIKTLPCVNELDPSFLDFIMYGENSVIEKWLGLGADGFRLDVADELPDEFIAKLKKRINEIKPGAILIGEVWEDASNKISYGTRRKYLYGDELDGVINYPFRDAIISFLSGKNNGIYFADSIMRIAENYPAYSLDCTMTVLSTHDTARIITLFGDNFDGTKDDKANRSLSPEAYKSAKHKLMAASFLQFMLPGSPCVYYGDEAGLQGWEDPFNRRFFPWGNEDKDLIEHYKNLALCRRKYPVLKKGNIRCVYRDEYTVHFSRNCEMQSAEFILNTGDSPYTTDSGDVIISRNTYTSGGLISVVKFGYCLIIRN